MQSRFFSNPSSRRFVHSTLPAHWDNGPEGNSARTAPVVGWPGSIQPSGRGVPMSSQLECSARAALCMSLARREPANRDLWMAEAENWSRLSKETSRRDWGKRRFRHLGNLAGAVGKMVFGVGNSCMKNGTDAGLCLRAKHPLGRVLFHEVMRLLLSRQQTDSKNCAGAA
jgi:hypothetical protein